MRTLTSFATLLTRFATVDLAAGAWPEAFEMPGKANLWRHWRRKRYGRYGAIPAIPLPVPICHTNMKFGMAAPYRSAEIWSIDFQENHKKMLPPDVRFKG